MSIFKIAWRSLQQRPLASLLTCVSMALGVALVVAVLVTHALVNDYLTRNTALGYHLVVGGKNGSKIDLVLSTVYHIRKPDFPLPWPVYKKFITSFDEQGVPRVGEFASSVRLAIPICLGDNYEGFRVVATTPQFFDLKYAGGGKSYDFQGGTRFKTNSYFDAVIGAEVARKTGLKVGDTFKPTHGVTDEPGATPHVHDDEFKVVGILQRTGTPNDRVLLINIEGFFMIEGHAKEDEQAAQSGKPHAGHEGHDHSHHKPVPESQREVTAVLLLCGGEAPPGIDMDPDILGSLAAQEIHRKLNKGNEAQADFPVRVVEELVQRFVNPLRWVLFGLTALTVFVAGVGIMVSIYNSMSGRRHEIAVMRALGASRAKVMRIVLCESILLALAGGLLGLVLGHGVVWAINPLLIEKAGISVDFWRMSPEEAFLLPALLLLATIIGYLPALTAYRTDVVRGLSATG